MRSERRQNWDSAASWWANATAAASAVPEATTRLASPIVQGLGRRHGAPGEDQVHGPPVPDEARQADGAEVAQRDAEAPAKHPEHCVLGGHPQVAPERELIPPATA